MVIVAIIITSSAHCPIAQVKTKRYLDFDRSYAIYILPRNSPSKQTSFADSFVVRGVASDSSASFPSIDETANLTMIQGIGRGGWGRSRSTDRHESLARVHGFVPARVILRRESIHFNRVNCFSFFLSSVLLTKRRSHISSSSPPSFIGITTHPTDPHPRSQI